MFSNFEKLIYEVKNTLLSSDDLKKLMFYPTPDALEKTIVPSYEDMKDRITARPVVYVYEESLEYGATSFISIGIIEFALDSGSIAAGLKISIACKREIWELNNNRIRPIAILSIIGNLLNNKKLSVAKKLDMKSAPEIYFNDELVGFTALFDVTEEKAGEVHEF